MNKQLYVVATPIGNRNDITIRALDILKTVTLIICEKKNKTIKLLQMHKIMHQNKKFIQYGDNNNTNKYIQYVIDNIKRHEKAVLVSEAGTPLISDPGFKLVNYIRSNSCEIEIISIPGASTITAFASISGIPTDKMFFVGFLPKSKVKKEKILKSFIKINNTLKTTFIIYESKYKILQTLELLRDMYHEAIVSIGEDLTKIHETVYYGNIKDIYVIFKNKKSIKGEFIIHLKL